MQMSEMFRANFKKNVCFLIIFFFFFFFFFLWQEIAFKSSLDLYFHPSIIEFRMEEQIHTKGVVGVCLEVLEEGFSWERLGRGLVGTHCLQ